MSPLDLYRKNEDQIPHSSSTSTSFYHKHEPLYEEYQNKEDGETRLRFLIPNHSRPAQILLFPSVSLTNKDSINASLFVKQSYKMRKATRPPTQKRFADGFSRPFNRQLVKASFTKKSQFELQVDPKPKPNQPVITPNSHYTKQQL